MLKTEGFDKAYKAYFDAIHTSAKKGFSILEVGGGAFPSFQNIEDYDYTIVDPDGDELTKGQECLKKINLKIGKDYTLVNQISTVQNNPFDEQSNFCVVLHNLKSVQPCIF